MEVGTHMLSTQTFDRLLDPSTLRRASSPSQNATLSSLEGFPSSMARSQEASREQRPSGIKIQRSNTKNQERPALKQQSCNVPATSAIVRPQQTGQDRQTRDTPNRKRMRTLEWACEQQTKRYKSTRNTHTELTNECLGDQHESCAIALLSLASSVLQDPPQDVLNGASLLLSLSYGSRLSYDDSESDLVSDQHNTP